jgi:hypothetical protein
VSCYNGYDGSGYGCHLLDTTKDYYGNNLTIPTYLWICRIGGLVACALSPLFLSPTFLYTHGMNIGLFTLVAAIWSRRVQNGSSTRRFGPVICLFIAVVGNVTELISWESEVSDAHEWFHGRFI